MSSGGRNARDICFACGGSGISSNITNQRHISQRALMLMKMQKTHYTNRRIIKRNHAEGNDRGKIILS